VACSGARRTEQCNSSAGTTKTSARRFSSWVCAGDAFAPGTLVDGEIVIADATGRSYFGALQGRLSIGKRDARSGASREPAVLLAFDLLKLVPGLEGVAAKRRDSPYLPGQR